MKRRTFTLAAATSAALIGTRARAQAAQASIRLNWYLGGSHGAFVLGRDRGYFKDEGIDLAINEGRGSVRSVQLIDSREDSFAMADAGSLMLGVARGAKARAVMTVVGVSSFCVVARKDSGITTLKDLQGKRLAVTAGDALTALWPAVVAANKLDANTIRLVMMDPAAKVPSVLEKQVDALLGGISDQPNLMRQRNVEPIIIPFYDVGVNTIGMSILTHPDTIQKQPELVRRFVRATTKSYEVTLAEPAAAAAAVKKMKADLVETTLLAEVNDSNAGTRQGLTSGKRIGWNDPASWQQTFELMRDYRELKTDMPATAFYTNDFAPT
ncbi:MAG: ABC transporter substrate-binding protein [Alphaproteobacteria bacterium]|nr:ABC transporter substrate-binding protein [Alphaproteobacteria bacterium]